MGEVWGGGPGWGGRGVGRGVFFGGGFIPLTPSLFKVAPLLHFPDFLLFSPLTTFKSPGGLPLHGVAVDPGQAGAQLHMYVIFRRKIRDP